MRVNRRTGALRLSGGNAQLAPAKQEKKNIIKGALRGLAALGVGLALFAGATAPQTAWADAAQDDGITVNLHDYDRTGSPNINSDQNDMKFGSDNYSGWNHYVGKGNGAYANIVENNLADGYPVLDEDTTDSNQSLAYLFIGGNTRSYVHDYMNTTGLLQKDSDGYWYFDSREDYARYNEDSNSFTLTDQDRNVNDVSVPLFTPFNDQYEWVHDRNGWHQQLTDTGDSNYSFGMDISAQFYMPEGGEVNGQNMVFSFTGDDDVWVYIDDVLVLDLGGIHDACSGEIDFATGKITYSPSSTYSGSRPSTLQEAFRTATGEDWDSTAYKTHTLKFFYLERGDGGSNCQIRFNLPTIPDGSVEIEKDVTYSNLNDVSDIDFAFNAYIDYDGDGKGYELYEGTYDVYEGRQRVEEGLTATDGVINLKDGQTARLITAGKPDGQRITRTSKYYVVETGASSDKYTVTVNGTTASWDGGSTENVKSPEFTVVDVAHVTFGNSISAINAFNLQVKKEGNVDTNATFYAKVMIGSLEYKGNYTVHNADESTTPGSTENGIIELKTGQYAEITGLVGGNTVTVSEVTSDGQPFVDQSDYQNPSYTIMGNNDGTLISSENVNDGSITTGISGTAAEGNALGDSPVIIATITNTSKVQPITVSNFLTVNKIVHGHALGANQFDFTVTPVADEETETTAEDAAKLARFTESVVTFHNEDSANAETSSLVRTGNTLTFTSDMLNKTYAFEYREVQNEFDQGYAGSDIPSDYTFDGSVYRVELTPEMKDGSTSEMHVKMEIFKDGNSIATVYNDGIETKTGSITFENTYQPLGLQVTKTDSGGNELSGAKFVLYEDSNNNDTFDDGENGDQPASGLIGTPTMASDGSVTTDADGHATFSGLQHGATYFLVEESVPSGYDYVLQGAYKIVVSVDGNTATMTDPNGTESDMNFDTTNRLFTTTITNSEVQSLPHSGSSGTVTLGAAGTAAVLVAGAYLTRRKRLTR